MSVSPRGSLIVTEGRWPAAAAAAAAEAPAAPAAAASRDAEDTNRAASAAEEKDTAGAPGWWTMSGLPMSAEAAAAAPTSRQTRSSTWES